MWIDIISLFIFLAGFVIGLGAVTVIEFHGFLARKSPYWTEATIRTHKVTKPLIWLGLVVAIAGGIALYRNSSLQGIPLIQALLALILVANGSFLSFVISPRLLKQEKEGRAQELLPKDMQTKITASFFVSIVCWWLSLFLLVLFVVE